MLAAAVRAGADGLFVTPTTFNYSQIKVIVDFAMTNRLPSIFGESDSVSAGGLMSSKNEPNDRSGGMREFFAKRSQSRPKALRARE